MLDKRFNLWYNKGTKDGGRDMTIVTKLDWMTDEEYNEVYWYWGCVCGYQMNWKNIEEYENWCKRILNKN